MIIDSNGSPYNNNVKKDFSLIRYSVLNEQAQSLLKFTENSTISILAFIFHKHLTFTHNS